MTDDTEWGPIVDHDGLPRPELNGKIARVWSANGRCEIGILNNCDEMPNGYFSAFVWASLPQDKYEIRIIRYRVRRPRALKQLRDMVENLPAPVRETENV